MNAWTVEGYYLANLNFSLTKSSLKILIILTIIIAIKTVIKNFKLLAHEDKKKVWLLVHGMLIMLSAIFPEFIGVLFIFLFIGLGYPYIHLMLIVNIFFIIEFIIIFSKLLIKKFRKKN
ncbi:MAG: hypothetical protein ACRCTZ_00830 [Sarcina sp.]